MNQIVQYRFLVLKSTWGISIGVKGYCDNDVIREKDIQVLDSLFVKIKKNVSVELKEMLIRGMVWAVDNFYIVPENRRTVVVEEINFGVSDFQMEGVFYAGAHFILELFNMEIPKVEVVFSRDANRYEFPNKEYEYRR